MSSKIAYILHKSGARILRNQPLNTSSEIRLTHLCTQRCRQCQVYQRKTEPASLNLQQFMFILKRLKEYGAHVAFISGGEPLLVEDLADMLVAAKQHFSLATTLVSGLYHKTETVRRIAKVCLENDINIQTSLDGLGDIGNTLRGVPHFAETVLQHMEMIANMRGSSKSLLYANIVMSDLNLEQIPTLIAEARKRGWSVSIGLYHHVTETTRADEKLQLRPGPRLDKILDFLDHNPDILNLEVFISGIKPYLLNGTTTPCPFVASRLLTTRTTIMENGDVHLCWGGSIGNIFQQTLEEMFTNERYKSRLQQYSACRGCWTVCYTQRYLLFHPGSWRSGLANIKKLIRLRTLAKEEK